MDYIKIFDWVIQASLFGSVLVLIILSIRKITINKINPIIIYYMWIILIVKLVIPFGPQSSISIYNYLNLDYNSKNIESYIGDYSQLNEIENKKVDQEIIKESNNNGFETDGNVNVNNNTELKDNNIIVKQTTLKEVLFLCWMVGVLFIIIRTIVSVIKLRKISGENTISIDESVNKVLMDCKALLKSNNKVKIVFSDSINSPSLCGILKPKIIIPSHMVEKLSDREMKYIILHELCHYKRKDLLISWLVIFIKTIHWFNPIVIFGLNTMRTDCELACDMKVLSYLSEKENVEYGNAIIDVLQLINNANWFPGTTSIIINKNQLKRRIGMICKNRKFNSKTLIIGIVVLICIGAVTLTGKVIKGDSAMALNNTDAVVLNQTSKEESNVVDSKSSGIIVTLNYKANENNTNSYIGLEEIYHLINVFNGNYTDIYINDIKVTKDSSFKENKSDAYIMIDNIKISTNEKLTVKALAIKDKIMDSDTNPNLFKFGSLVKYDISAERSDSISVPKVDSKENNYTYIDITDEISGDVKEMIEKGNVVMVSVEEVYNANIIDNFMDNFKNGKADKIRIIKYGGNESTHPNKLIELETDGSVIKTFEFNTYAEDKRYRALAIPSYSVKITKQTNGAVRYALHDTMEDPDNMGATLISYK